MTNSTKFSDDDFKNDSKEQQLRLEIEILKIKMQAEYGAMFGTSPQFPPQMEYEFLKNVLQFEEAIRKKNTHPLSPTGIESPFPGDLNFVSKGYHQDHKKEIEFCAMKFLEGFFKKNNFVCGQELHEEFVLPDGSKLKKLNVLNKIINVAKSLDSVSHNRYLIEESAFRWNEITNCGLGHAEGVVQIDGCFKNGDAYHIVDKFKFYMSSEGFGWSIFYFVFPGFKW